MPKRTRHIDYPIGSISCGTMREEDLIPTFCAELERLAKQTGIVRGNTRSEHRVLVRNIEKRMNDSQDNEYFESGPHGDSQDDLESLFDALQEYAGPYFYFGSHPGDGSDYGFWLSEDWDEDFQPVRLIQGCGNSFEMKAGENWLSVRGPSDVIDGPIRVEDLTDVPSWFRGEVAVVNDHGNVSLYRKTSRGVKCIWEVI